MLALARKKLPHIRFYRQNMTSFNIAKQFDAIVCLFDSINHLYLRSILQPVNLKALVP